MTRSPFNPERIAAGGDTRFPKVATARPMTVSQLTALVKQAIESSLPPTVHVVGEISNFKRHGSGHLYLTLKDAFSELACVIWRSEAAKLKFEPKDGQEVVATGTVEVFERAGRYQLYIRRLEPRGIGALELGFRQLCEKLGKEGLFDPRRKRPLPRFPGRIAIVTSPTGAAVADILRTLQRRYPCCDILLFPVRVQGDGAAAEIAGAIRSINAHAPRLGGIDVMIVGRGGGSLEDLWAFNEEVVARAIFQSAIPVVSAVGHEVDITIADLVADVRAATPTAAAELVAPMLSELADDLSALGLRIGRNVHNQLIVAESNLRAVLHRRPFREPLTIVRHRTQPVDEAVHGLQRGMVDCLRTVRRRLERLEPFLQRIAPHAFLLRIAVRFNNVYHRLRWAIRLRIGFGDRRLSALSQRVGQASPVYRINARGVRLQELCRLLGQGMDHRLTLALSRVQSLSSLLGSVSHKSVLARGFSITRTKKGRSVVRSIRKLHDRQRIVTELADGQFESETVNIKQMELFEPS